MPLKRYIGLRNRFVATTTNKASDVPRCLSEASELSSTHEGQDARIRPPHIVFQALRDPSDLEDILNNTDQFVACRSFRGVNKVSDAKPAWPASYICDFILPYHRMRREFSRVVNQNL